MSDSERASDAAQDAALDGLVPAARLFGRLFVRELDSATLQELRTPDVAAELDRLGIEVPDDSQLPVLAGRYFELFLHPEGAMPPVMSLWRDGQYDGDPARSIRQIADAANRELAEGARSAPPDHLGCILLLWGELCESRRELADLLRTRHLAWAELALQGASKDTGFYGAVSRAAISLIRSLL